MKFKCKRNDMTDEEWKQDDFMGWWQIPLQHTCEFHIKKKKKDIMRGKGKKGAGPMRKNCMENKKEGKEKEIGGRL